MNIFGHKPKRRRPKDPKSDWKTIFIAHGGGFSSKRIVGVIGAFICFGMLIAAFIMEKEVPQFADMVIVTSTSLLGVDAFRGVFSKTTSN